MFSSGRPEHRTHFRPIADWYQIGPVLGNYTCGSYAREDVVGGEYAADTLRYLVATKSRAVTQRKLRAL